MNMKLLADLPTFVKRDILLWFLFLIVILLSSFDNLLRLISFTGFYLALSAIWFYLDFKTAKNFKTAKKKVQR